jgi:LruC domain-containing protein
MEIPSESAVVIGSTSQVQSPVGFSFSMMEPRAFSVQVSTPAGLPYPEAAVHLLSASGDLIETQPTNDLGTAMFRASAPEGYLRVYVDAAGIPNETLSISATSPSLAIPEAFSARAAAAGSPNAFAGREQSWTIPVTISSGLPTGIDATRRSEVTGSFLADVNFAFPEQSRVQDKHPEYIQAGNTEEILLSDSAEMILTFLHEGAGYRNSFGYYVVPPNGTISSASTLDKRILLPNASLQGSGGALVAGDRIRLGNFSAGTRIGFFLIADGWTGTRVDTSGKPTYYSRSALNPESDEASRHHMAMLLHQGTGKAVLGFEDLNRNSSGCDHDFNDALFTVSWNPFAAIKTQQFAPLPNRTDSDQDGISDNVDEFPLDASRAFNRYFPSDTGWGIAAFEDLWPRLGDFDFNDLVVRYRIRETKNSKQEVRDLDITLLPVAAGASLHSGLAVGFGSLSSAPESVLVRAGGRVVLSPLLRSSSTGETVLRATKDALSLFQGGGGQMINTRSGGVRYGSDTIHARVVFQKAVALPDPPYDLFLFQTADSAHEIHFPDRKGTNSAKRSLYRTKDDKTDSVNGTWYRSAGNLPWAINMPGDWRYPLEGVDILQAYPHFSVWINSNGRTNLDWYVRPSSDRLVSP